MISRAPALALAAALLAAAPLRAQVLDAFVLDPQGREPVAVSEVVLLAGDGATVARARTRADGWVRLRAPATGTWRVRVTRDDAVLLDGPVQLTQGETTEVELLAGAGPVAAAQTGDAVALDPLVAEAAAQRRYLGNAGFYDRQRTTSGVFFTGQELSERSGARLVDRLRGVRGTVVRPAGASGWIFLQRTTPNTMGRGTTCVAALWVDGRQASARMLADVRLEDVDGVEVYEANEVPLRFAPVNRGGRPVCGAVVIWLKAPVA